MSEISFSVIIPAYNAAGTIVAAVSACIEQTLAPHEIIVVNDCSTDDTAKVISEAFGKNVRLINLPINSGPSAARNAGFAVASGTHIAFQDADDMWHREKLEHIAEVLTKAPHIQFIFHPYTLSSVDFAVPEAMLQPLRYSFFRLLLSNPIGPQCVVMRRDKSIHFDERMRHMEDYELFLRRAWEVGVYRLDAPFTQVGRPMLAPGGLSGNRWKMRVGEMRAWVSLTKRHPVFGLALPFLIVFSITKHIVKSFSPPRSNY